MEMRTRYRRQIFWAAFAAFLGLSIVHAARGAGSFIGGQSPPTGISSTESSGQVTNAWKVPAFRLVDLQGESHSLADWKGKVILLNFWASWCAPCYYETRDLIAFQTRYGSQGLQVVGIGLDETGKIRNFARTLGVNYPLLVAEPTEHPRIMEPWGNGRQLLPYTVVIDRDGDIEYVQRGLFSKEAFEELVLPLLGDASR